MINHCKPYCIRKLYNQDFFEARIIAVYKKYNYKQQLQEDSYN